MGRFLDIVDRYAKGHPTSEIPEPSGVPDIATAQRSVAETRQVRGEWAKACLALAESLDWEPVEFKRGYTAGTSGAYGWKLFCNRANLTTLRDQTYPALLERLSMDRPPEIVQ